MSQHDLDRAHELLSHMEGFSYEGPTGYFSAENVIGDTQKVIDDLKEAGEAVEDLEFRFRDLLPEARRAFAIKKIIALLRYSKNEPSGYFTKESVVHDAERSIQEARESGADVQDLETAFLEISVKVKKLVAPQKARL